MREIHALKEDQCTGLLRSRAQLEMQTGIPIGSRRVGSGAAVQSVTMRYLSPSDCAIEMRVGAKNCPA